MNVAPYNAEFTLNYSISNVNPSNKPDYWPPISIRFNMHTNIVITTDIRKTITIHHQNCSVWVK
jgi:hypothetical protein